MRWLDLWLGAAIGMCACGPHRGLAHELPRPTPARPIPPPSVVGAPRYESRFELVLATDCKDSPRVEDLESRTLVISSKVLRFVDPGQAWSDTSDTLAGLPIDRGHGSVFTRTPLVVQVEWQPHSSMFQSSASDYGFYWLLENRWVLIKQSFGEIPIALPVATGTVVVGWTDEGAQHRGDSDMVPAGNMTRAWLIALDSQVSELTSWPHVMTWHQQGTLHTLWAIAVRPGQSGYFLLRVPLDGKAAFYPIPGVARCVGIDRLSGLASLDAVTDDSAELTVSEGTNCVTKKLAGRYHFHDGRFTRVGEAKPPEESGPADEKHVRAGDAMFSLDGDTVVVHRNGAVERSELPGAVSTEPHERFLETSAGGREVWVQSFNGERCFLHRYRW